MEIKELEYEHLKEALNLVTNVFMEFEAPDYSTQGILEFNNFVKYDNMIEKFLNKQMCFWGCYIDDKLVGVIATRNKNHISLLFVKKEFHRQGIAKNLFLTVLKECNKKNLNVITVNSSPYAIDVYHHLGFTDTDKEQEINGIRFTPMNYIIKNELVYFTNKIM